MPGRAVGGTPKFLSGRGGGIRTPGPLVPNQMRYQAALRPDLLIIPRYVRRKLVPLASGPFQITIMPKKKTAVISSPIDWR